MQNLGILAFAFFAFAPFSMFSAQIEPPKSPVQPNYPKRKDWKTAKIARNESDQPAEKSIEVDAKINISLCVSDGKLKINGWDRNEIRAFVSDGSEVGFDIRQKNKQNKPVWLMVVGFDPAKKADANFDECLSGSEIEIDVPRGATVNVKSQASETAIDSVYKTDVKNVGGDIFLNNIAQGIDATTYEGSVTVQKSSGAITLSSTTGNIVAFDISPAEIGDIFKAKTSSGAITLQQIEHRQMEINSNSGSMKYTGEFLSGGQYTFGTSNGSILLAMPEKSSCKISALYGFGKFNSDLKLEIITINNTSKAQSLVASIGGGGATVNLTTYSGAIRIKKL